MKKLKLIYNPFSGDKSFKNSLSDCIHVFQSYDYDVHVFRSSVQGDISEHIDKTDINYDLVVVAGGDGTVNLVLNAMKNTGMDCPLGIIPAGTANDFATYLKIPMDHIEAAEHIMNGKVSLVDIGCANGQYFINVCSAGMFTDISHNIPQDAKVAFGKLAYYVKGIEQIPNFLPIPVRITNSENVIEDKIFLFLALNSAGTGGFLNLSPTASLTDGKFDFIAFRACQIFELARVFMNVLKGDFLNDPNVIFFQDSYIKVEFLVDNKVVNYVDLDGEQSHPMPVEILNCNKALKLMC